MSNRHKQADIFVTFDAVHYANYNASILNVNEICNYTTDFKPMSSIVFIIDDDSIHHRIAQIIIEKFHLFDKYESYTDPEKVIDILKQQAKQPELLPDVILLDLNMPDVNGWDFLDMYEKIRPELSKDIRIYIVTSSVDENDKMRSKTYYAVKGFISKPLSPEIMRTVI